jgi:hypothetical protein
MVTQVKVQNVTISWHVSLLFDLESRLSLEAGDWRNSTPIPPLIAGNKNQNLN